MRVALLCLLILPVSCAFLSAQSPNSLRPAVCPHFEPLRKVVLELIVRDKHGHLIKDLKPEDIQIYEDGVRQTVKVFRNIQGSEQLEAEQKAAQAKRHKHSFPPISPILSIPCVRLISFPPHCAARNARRAIQPVSGGSVKTASGFMALFPLYQNDLMSPV